MRFRAGQNYLLKWTQLFFFLYIDYCILRLQTISEVFVLKKHRLPFLVNPPRLFHEHIHATRDVNKFQFSSFICHKGYKREKKKKKKII